MKSSDGKVDAGNKGGSPGPGAYNLKGSIGNEGVRPTISSRKSTGALGATSYAPGPGAYSPSVPRDNGPAYRYSPLLSLSLGSAQRGTVDKESKLVPGPGAYDPAEKTASGKSSAHGWG